MIEEEVLIIFQMLNIFSMLIHKDFLTLQMWDISEKIVEKDI
jgi:hypothetical protein